MHKDFKSHVEIKSIDETKRIGKWLCDGFSLKPKEPLDSDDDFLFELWVTRDVNIDFNLIYHVIEQSDSGSPAQLDRIVGEILKFFEINGFPIEIKSTLKSGEYTIYSSLKAMEISERTPPEWLYTVPKDYKDLKKILEASNKNRKKAGKRRRRRR